MARSLWTGSLSFGLVNVPVALVSAVRDLGIHFHQLDEKTKARIEVKRVCSGRCRGRRSRTGSRSTARA
jgi:DNA end-binding protein Ku